MKEGKKQMLKVINYPQDLKAAHDLIDLLVQTINEVNDNNFDGDVPSTGIHSVPLTTRRNILYTRRTQRRHSAGRSGRGGRF